MVKIWNQIELNPRYLLLATGTEKLLDSNIIEHFYLSIADFETRLQEVLGMMSGGREVTVPKAIDGSEYTPTTIRVLEEGQFMGWHFGNQFLHCTPGYKYLATQINTEVHLGYFLMLSPAEAGGELILYDLEWDQTEWTDTENGGRKRNGMVNGKLIADVMEDYAQMSISPKAGSLVIFDDSRILHRVSTVQGSQWSPFLHILPNLISL